MDSYLKFFCYSFIISCYFHIVTANCKHPKPTIYCLGGPIKNASDAIKRADKDGDGKLNEQEAWNHYNKTNTVRLSNETIKVEFNWTDKNQDGYLTADEINSPASPAPSASTYPSKPYVLSRVKEQDVKFNYTEAFDYITYILPLRLSDEASKTQIKFMDKNQDGYLTKDEINSA